MRHFNSSPYRALHSKGLSKLVDCLIKFKLALRPSNETNIDGYVRGQIVGFNVALVKMQIMSHIQIIIKRKVASSLEKLQMQMLQRKN